MPQPLFRIGDRVRIETPWDATLHGTIGMIVDSIYNQSGPDKGSICFTIQLEDRLVRIDQRFIRALNPPDLRRPNAYRRLLQWLRRKQEKTA